MKYLVDYENTKTAGLVGSSLVSANDEVNLFYSEHADTVPRGYFETLTESGCILNAYKLRTVAKDALDFYIASRTGELIGQGCKESIAIISKDNGYRRVEEYWNHVRNISNRIILSGSISDAWAQNRELYGDSHIKQQEKEKIGTLFERYKVEQAFRQHIENIFSDTEYAGCTDQILRLVDSKASKADLYRSSLQEFGRSKGTDIYRLLREVV